MKMHSLPFILAIGLTVILSGCGKSLQDCEKLTDPTKVFQCNASNFEIFQEKQEEFKRKAAEEIAKTGAATQTIKEMNEWTEKMKAITKGSSSGKKSSTFNSVYADPGTGQYGIVAGHPSQKEADTAAEKYCQDSRMSSNCQKIYGDDLSCVAYATPINGGLGGVGTGDFLIDAKEAALKFCGKSINASPDQCRIDDKSGFLCTQ